jgi:hypothetical protein
MDGQRDTSPPPAAPVTNWERHCVSLAWYCYAVRHGMKVHHVTPYRVSLLQSYGVTVRGKVPSVYPPLKRPVSGCNIDVEVRKLFNALPAIFMKSFYLFWPSTEQFTAIVLKENAVCLICILEAIKAISVRISALIVGRCYWFALLSAQEAISLNHLRCLVVRCLPLVLALCSASGAESTVRKCKAVWSMAYFPYFF